MKPVGVFRSVVFFFSFLAKLISSLKARTPLLPLCRTVPTSHTSTHPNRATPLRVNNPPHTVTHNPPPSKRVVTYLSHYSMYQGGTGSADPQSTKYLHTTTNQTVNFLRNYLLEGRQTPRPPSTESLHTTHPALRLLTTVPPSACYC